VVFSPRRRARQGLPSPPPPPPLSQPPLLLLLLLVKTESTPRSQN
jgi:hypothetical protein